ncbi:Katanin p60 ATPase-containing subunit A-like 2 isoform C [Glycine soja]|uniref:Katanin p60 ATPase-containing subunit A-like 2 isoform C n=1 Tax=Glycine soja TaxID=3848 RepID=A0A445JBQ0_GLYSO|nr:Katanin p60 ATPase-containing subunit A-like 2 isoform C [Glycine soja]
MADDPMPTRWSFQDFKLCYDAKFGRKKVAENGDDAAGKAVSNGNGNSVTVAIVSNGNKRASEMAVYEQFRSEGQNQIHTNGFVPTLTDERPQKSLLPPFESAEMRALAESLSRYFTGLLSPWKGILLFGPPGTGKTMLAKAVATECNTTFFNISASSVVSKWRGDSEKLVKVLFELARYHAPSTIFLDEIDAIISQRGEARSEHEASRRLKTELLIQMDGLTKTDELVFVLAATNLPWELDAAMLRRLEKRILVPLPEPVARRAMFEELLPQQPGEESIPYDILEDKTEGYSGSDIRLLCKETAMQPLRRLMSQLEQNQDVVPEEELPKVGPIRSEDIETALRNTRPSAHLHAHKYDKFNADYGSQILQ